MSEKDKKVTRRDFVADTTKVRYFGGRLDGTIRRREHAQAKESHACGEFSDPRSRSPQG